MKIKKSKTSRGFGLWEFQDMYNSKCSFQESSLAEKECIWIGVDSAIDCKNKEVLINARMHLSRSDCKKIAKILNEFADKGWEMFRPTKKDKSNEGTAKE